MASISVRSRIMEQNKICGAASGATENICVKAQIIIVDINGKAIMRSQSCFCTDVQAVCECIIILRTEIRKSSIIFTAKQNPQQLYGLSVCMFTLEPNSISRPIKKKLSPTRTKETKKMETAQHFRGCDWQIIHSQKVLEVIKKNNLNKRISFVNTSTSMQEKDMNNKLYIRCFRLPW